MRTTDENQETHDMNEKLLTPGVVVRHGWEQPFAPGGALPRFVTSIASPNELVWHNVTDPEAISSGTEYYVRTDLAPGIVQITWKESPDTTDFGVVWTLNVDSGRIHGVIVNADPKRNMVLSGDFRIDERTIAPVGEINGASPDIAALPTRKGTRPVTGDALPHLQFTDNSPQGIYDELADWLFSLPEVEEAPSRISVQGARGAVVRSEADGVMTENEFTHIHPMEVYGGGSQHLALPDADSQTLIAKGWGEYHPMNLKAFPNQDFGLILLYAPRDEEELEVVKTATLASHRSARAGS